MTKWEQLADDATIHKTATALAAQGITVHVAESGEAARAKALEVMPQGARVMNMTSVTLSTIGLADDVEKSGRYVSVRAQLADMDHATEESEMRALGAAPEWAAGSVHAVTEDGHVLIASASGSQLPAYAYGARHVVWVVGAQKLVATIEEGMKRIYEHCLPLESERARKAYGVPGSSVNKIFILNKESQKDRITMIIAKEKLGF